MRNTTPCSTCGKPATCFGMYEGVTGFACDECCGHGCEDGKCEPIGDFPVPGLDVPNCVMPTAEERQHGPLTSEVLALHRNLRYMNAAYRAMRKDRDEARHEVNRLQKVHTDDVGQLLAQRDAAVERLRALSNACEVWGTAKDCIAHYHAKQFLATLATLPATEADKPGDSTAEAFRKAGAAMPTLSPAFRAAADLEAVTPITVGHTGDSTAGGECPTCNVTMHMDDFMEQQREVIALRSRLDAAGVVIAGLLKIVTVGGVPRAHVMLTREDHAALATAREWQAGKESTHDE